MCKISSNLKEAAGYIKEETGEALNDQSLTQQGRNLRNEGRVEKGEFPKMTKPGDRKKN